MLEIDDATFRVVRELRGDGALVVRMVAWSASYADPYLAIDAYEALARHEDRLTYWSVGATALGADWLNPTISMLVENYLSQRAEDARSAPRVHLQGDPRPGKFLRRLRRAGLHVHADALAVDVARNVAGGTHVLGGGTKNVPQPYSSPSGDLVIACWPERS